MRREIRHEELRCDFCPTSTRVERGDQPAGWSRVVGGPCGLTDYYDTRDRCPACTARKAGEP